MKTLSTLKKTIIDVVMEAIGVYIYLSNKHKYKK